MNRDDEYQHSLEQTKWALEQYKQYLVENRPDCATVEFTEGPTYADYDYMVKVNSVFDHYLEVKIRRNSFYKYDYIKVPLRKHTFAEHTLNSDGTTSYFLGLFEDSVLAFVDLSKEPSTVLTQATRFDRNDGQETDVYATYHQSTFNIIWTK